jgi:signal peptidase II
MTFYIWLILAICVLDQLTKLYAMDIIATSCGKAVAELSEGDTLPIVKDVLHMTYVQNEGMSFGWFSDSRWVFLIAATAGILALFAYLIYLKGQDKLLSFSLALMIGGGIGNMFDRVALGYVVDFVDFCYFDFWKWVFNFADACICIGAALMVISVLVSYKKEKANA